MKLVELSHMVGTTSWRRTARVIENKLAAAAGGSAWIGSIRLGHNNTSLTTYRAPALARDERAKLLPHITALAQLRYLVEHYREDCYDDPAYREIELHVRRYLEHEERHARAKKSGAKAKGVPKKKRKLDPEEVKNYVEQLMSTGTLRHNIAGIVAKKYGVKPRSIRDICPELRRRRKMEVKAA